MAGRVPEMSLGGPSGSQDVEPASLVTPQLVDRAVEQVLRPFPEETRAEYVRAWGADETSEVSKLLQRAMAAEGNRLKSYQDVARKPIIINHALSEAEQESITKRYPDVELIFRPTVGHDHPLAAADRKISDVLLHSRIPAHMRYVDFGGSILMHVEAGNRNVLVVGGLHDKKDAARATIIRMRLRRITGDETASSISREMARSVLANEGEYYVDGSLEKFDQKFRAGVMSHVYDVPLVEVAKMMERCGMLLFEGVMHHSERVHFETEGELPSVGARFRVVEGSRRKKKEFQMGFIDSPSHWYGHSYDQYMHYGADQIMNGSKKRYSYKIHEKRGETISFRVLETGPRTEANSHQYFSRPGVPLVEVSTFEHGSNIDTEAGKLRDVKRRYPEDVWERMVRSAMLDASRGDLNFHKHIRSYRSITAGHMYNGVTTVSEKVPSTDVPWLAVDSAVYALSQVMLMRRGLKVFVGEEMERRLLARGSMVDLLAKATLDSLIAITKLPLWGLKRTGRFVTGWGESHVNRLIDVAPVPRFVRVDPSTLISSKKLADTPVNSASAFPWAEYVSSTADVHQFVEELKAQAKLEEEMAPKADSKGEMRIEGELHGTDEGSATYVAGTASEAAGTKPDWVPLEPPGSKVVENYEYFPGAHGPEERRDAVFEAIKACQAEAKTLEVWCADRYTQFAGGRKPDVDEVRRQSEANRDFDFWPVNSGVISNSILGRAVDDMTEAGVYCPVPVQVLDADGVLVDTNLIPVKEATYEYGKVFNNHKVIEMDYTGYIMTCRDLTVFNGRQLAAGLRASTGRGFSQEIAGMIGGPGCGKSYSIVKLFKRGDMVVTPLVHSAKSLRRDLVEAGKLTESAAFRCVRTLDSVLCAAGSGQKMLTADRVLVDECCNVIAGKYYAVLALLGARRSMMYGDDNQIPPGVRAEMALTYKLVSFPHIVRRWTVFRSAAPVLACFNGHYGDKLRTARVGEGTVKVVHDVNLTLPSTGTLALLVMNQAKKADLRRLYPKNKGQIHTVHEMQGGEADTVILFNFETRKMSDDNPTYLYNRDEYVNVAISRAKFHFVYACLSSHQDLVKKWIERGGTPAFVKGAADAQTAGEPIA